MAHRSYLSRSDPGRRLNKLRSGYVRLDEAIAARLIRSVHRSRGHAASLLLETSKSARSQSYQWESPVEYSLRPIRALEAGRHFQPPSGAIFYLTPTEALGCGRAPCAALRALGRKVSDEFSVPLCRTHHRQVHDRGDERVKLKILACDRRLLSL